MSPTRTKPSARISSGYDSDSEVEVIEDSEPEREKRRKRERLEKTQLRNNSPVSDSLSSTKSAKTSILPPPSQLSPPMSVTSFSTISNKSPLEVVDSQALPVPHSTSSAPVREVAPPPWLSSKENSAPNLPLQSAPNSPQRTKPLTQPSPVKQLDINSFVFHKRASGARSASYSTSSRSTSTSKSVNVQSSGPSKVASVSSTKSSSSPKTFHLGATNGSPSIDVMFTSEQIGSINGCVVCGNSWTVRKQPKSKWSHITSCARKNGCESETLHIKLIAAFVEASETKARKSAKGKEKEPTAPQSLLAHTVQEHAPPKRRGWRKEPGPSNLQPVEDAQKMIIQRSALLLGIDILPDDQSESQQTVLDQDLEAENKPFDMPATQAFAPSKIAGRSKFFGSASSVLNTDTNSGLFYADEPQVLVRNPSPNSAVGSPSSSPNSNTSIPFTSHSHSDSAPISINSSIISIRSSNDNSSPGGFQVSNNHIRSPTRSDSSASVVILDSPPVRDVSPVFDKLEGSEGDWDSRDGVYLWDDYMGDEVERATSPLGSLTENLNGLSMLEPQNEDDLTAALRGRSQSPHELSKSISKRTTSNERSNPFKGRLKDPPSRPSLPDSLVLPRLSGNGNGTRSSSSDRPLAETALPKENPKSKAKATSVKPPKKPSKKKAAASTPEITPHGDEDQVTLSKDFGMQLLEMITTNESLYLRILRYEPIKFEDLVEMAIACGIPKHGLQLKMKSFLDSQCINFYSGDNLGRKKRH